MKKVWLWIAAAAVATGGIVFGLHVSNDSYSSEYGDTSVVQEDGHGHSHGGY